MKKYSIPVTWMMSNTITVEANSLEEAVEKVDRLPLPEGEYINDSFRVEAHHIEDMHFDEQIKEEARAYAEEHGDE
jgi:hypothetical protein